MVSPEDFGAVGDGITDDTAAWQNAINTGQDVKAESSRYKCQQLNITHSAKIDCNNATFIALDTILFNCTGTVIKETVEANYTANQSYQLSDSFTGIAWISGVNNVFRQRSYYRGGSVEEFKNGKMLTTIPVDIVSPTVYELQTIAVNISNIANVEFASTDNAVVIKMQYCSDSIVSNVNMTNLCYSIVQFWQCYNCSYIDSSFSIPQYGSSGTYYYPVAILDTCYTALVGLIGRCAGWHCATTGNHTLCRGTLVDNCDFRVTEYAIPGYSDHSNGIETKIINSTLTSVGLGANSSMENCTILADESSYQQCHVNLGCSSVDGLAKYSIKNCRFKPMSEAYSGVRVYLSPQEAGYGYDYHFNELLLVDCYNENPKIAMPVKNGISSNVTGTVRIDVISVINSNSQITATAKTKAYSVHA